MIEDSERIKWIDEAFADATAKAVENKEPLFHANVKGIKVHSFDGRAWYKEDGTEWIIPGHSESPNGDEK